MFGSKDIQAIRNAFQSYNGGPPKEGQGVSGLASVMLDLIKKDTRIRPRSVKSKEEEKMNIKPADKTRRLKISRERNNISDAIAKEAYEEGFKSGTKEGFKAGEVRGYANGVVEAQRAQTTRDNFAGSRPNYQLPEAHTARPTITYQYFFDLERDLYSREALINWQGTRYSSRDKTKVYVGGTRMSYDITAEHHPLDVDALVHACVIVVRQAALYVDIPTFVPSMVAYLCGNGVDTLNYSHMMAIPQDAFVDKIMEAVGYVEPTPPNQAVNWNNT